MSRKQRFCGLATPFARHSRAAALSSSSSPFHHPSWTAFGGRCAFLGLLAVGFLATLRSLVRSLGWLVLEVAIPFR